MEMRELTFEYEKETPNTVRFIEVVAEGDTPVIDKLYVRKSAIKGKRPEKITMVLGEPATV